MQSKTLSSAFERIEYFVNPFIVASSYFLFLFNSFCLINDRWMYSIAVFAFLKCREEIEWLKLYAISGQSAESHLGFTYWTNSYERSKEYKLKILHQVAPQSSRFVYSNYQDESKLLEVNFKQMSVKNEDDVTCSKYDYFVLSTRSTQIQFAGK